MCCRISMNTVLMVIRNSVIFIVAGPVMWKLIVIFTMHHFFIPIHTR